MAYYSKKYTPAKNNYKIYSKELLIIIYYLKAWDMELRSVFKGFDIITDYKNIQYFIKKIIIKRAVNVMVPGINLV